MAALCGSKDDKHIFLAAADILQSSLKIIDFCIVTKLIGKYKAIKKINGDMEPIFQLILAIVLID